MTADDALVEQELRLVEAKAAAVCSHPALPEDFKPLCLREDAAAALARLGKAHVSFIHSFIFKDNFQLRDSQGLCIFYQSRDVMFYSGPTRQVLLQSVILVHYSLFVHHLISLNNTVLCKLTAEISLQTNTESRLYKSMVPNVGLGTPRGL